MKKHFIYLILFLSFLFSPNITFGIQNKIDSLLHELSIVPEDTNKIKILYKLAEEFFDFNSDSTILFANQALDLCTKLDTKFIKYKIYNSLGSAYFDLGNYDKALENHFRSLKLSEDGDNRRGMAGSCNNIGMVYDAAGETKKALEFYTKAQKINEETGNKRWLAINHNNIGNLYEHNNNDELALEYHLRAMKIREEINDQYNLAASYHNVAGFYAKKDPEKALEYYYKAVRMNEETGNKTWLSNNYGMIGALYSGKNDYEKSLEFTFKSLKLIEERGDLHGIARMYNAIGTVHFKFGKYDQAFEYYQKALVIAKTNDFKPLKKSIFYNLAKYHEKKKEWSLAYSNMCSYSSIKDSLFNEESSKHLAEMQAKYETGKKDAEIKLLNKDNEIAVSENKKQKLIIYFVIGGLLLVAFFSVLIFYRWRVSQKQKQIIEEQKRIVDKSFLELDIKNKIIEEKNKETTDSINYAKRIQDAKLPLLNEIQKALTDCFVLFKPKDIVSGDFYFYSKKGNNIFIAAADCTGHGVPGAFMSLIGYEQLNEAVQNNDNADQILKQLNNGIKQSLRQSDNVSSTRDGMDIALCSINTESMVLNYAGANRPLWIVKKSTGKLEETKATKQAIGGLTDYDQLFETHTIQLTKGDTIYLSSDGYADQDGGVNGKKLMTKRFKELLLELANESMPGQKTFLENYIDKWRGAKQQMDDILVIGIRV